MPTTYKVLKRHGELLAIIILIVGVVIFLVYSSAEEQPGTNAKVEAKNMINTLVGLAKIISIVVFVSLIVVLFLGVVFPKYRRAIGI